MEDRININGFVIEKRPDFIPNKNILLQDTYHMGAQIGSNIAVLFAKHKDEKHEYIILVNTETGKRIYIDLRERREGSKGSVAVHRGDFFCEACENDAPLVPVGLGDCNGWECEVCGNNIPEIGSFKLNNE